MSPRDNPATSGRGRRVFRRRFFTIIVLLGALFLLRPLMVNIALWRAAVCLEERSHTRSLRWLQFATLTGDDSAELHYFLARVNRRIKRYPQVHEHLRAAHERGWNTDSLRREYMLASAQTGDFELLRDYWATLFNSAGSDGPEISDAYVRFCIRELRLEDAAAVLAAWERDFPDDAQPHIRRGQISEATGNWTKMVEEFGRALQLNPTRIDGQLGLVRGYMGMAKYERAEQLLRQVVQVAPDNPEAAFRLGRTLLKLGRENESRDALKTEVDSHPDNFDALAELGNLELQTDRPAEALAALEHAVELRPSSTETRFSRGKALQALGRKDEAADDFRFVQRSTKPLIRLSQLTTRLPSEPKNVELRFEIASITWEFRSRDEGLQWYRSVLALDPDHQDAHAAVARHDASTGDREQTDEPSHSDD